MYKKLDKYKDLKVDLVKQLTESTNLKSTIKQDIEKCRREIKVSKIEIEDELSKRSEALEKKKKARKELDKVLEVL